MAKQDQETVAVGDPIPRVICASFGYAFVDELLTRIPSRSPHAFQCVMERAKVFTLDDGYQVSVDISPDNPSHVRANKIEDYGMVCWISVETMINRARSSRYFLTGYTLTPEQCSKMRCEDSLGEHVIVGKGEIFAKISYFVDITYRFMHLKGGAWVFVGIRAMIPENIMREWVLYMRLVREQISHGI